MKMRPLILSTLLAVGFVASSTSTLQGAPLTKNFARVLPSFDPPRPNPNSPDPPLVSFDPPRPNPNSPDPPLVAFDPPRPNPNSPDPPLVSFDPPRPNPNSPDPPAC
jgi:hypothetical protein